MAQNRTTSAIKMESSSTYAALLEVETGAGDIDDRWETRRWARGFLRLWIASAAIWIAVVGLFALSDLHSQEHVELAAWAFIPPACTLAIVLALVWMRRGFRARQR